MTHHMIGADIVGVKAAFGAISDGCRRVTNISTSLYDWDVYPYPGDGVCFVKICDISDDLSVWTYSFSDDDIGDNSSWLLERRGDEFFAREFDTVYRRTILDLHKTISLHDSTLVGFEAERVSVMFLNTQFIIDNKIRHRISVDGSMTVLAFKSEEDFLRYRLED